jgi:hypothetical protein
MRPRTARRIVSHVTSGNVTHKSYDLPLVHEAFRSTGTELTDELLQPWTDHADKQKARREAANAKTPEAQERRRQRAMHEAKKAADLARNKREMAQRRQLEKMEELAQANRPLSGEPGKLWEGQQPADNLAVAAGREAFKEAVGAKIEDMPETVTLETVEQPADDGYEAMKVGELKDTAGGRGLKGYSKLKKADLIALLRKYDADFPRSK